MSSTSIPQTMKALVQHAAEHKAEVKNVPVPKLDKNEILIKVAYVAQNPIGTSISHVVRANEVMLIPASYVDYKMSSLGMSPPNSILGFDFSGIVAALGEDLSNPFVKIGDRVAGMVHGGMFTDKGSFAEYVRAASDLVWFVPSNLGLRAAAGVTATLGTAAQALFAKLDLPYPLSQPERPSDDPAKCIAIYGGSSSVGLFAIQLAKFVGYKVVTTCSPRNFNLVKEYGADVVVDYHDAEVAIQEIRNVTSGRLTKALDCISADNSAILCLKALADDDSHGKRKLVQVGPPTVEAEQFAKERGIELDRLMAFTLFGNPVTLGPGFTVPASPSDRAFYAKLNHDIPTLIEKFGLKPNPITDMQNGLQGIVDEGFGLMQSGKVSATKLVYRVSEV
ncbi:hypothetical protein QFC19_008080 [Naganishia cerealis]|uniref:Uncharacterized protein n=1 Tax=Naganishia cerealis TaxID=610337 RepID=A0ACC2V4T4_9TREE|nr:hypothetical protein QFC19_008080 [Naganishia cerealis]